MFHGGDEVKKLWTLLDVIMDLGIPFVSNGVLSSFTYDLTSLIKPTDHEPRIVF